MQKVAADRQSKADHQDPGFKLNDITSMILNFHTETNAILSIPKPKPPAPADPKPEDTPMKDESKKEEGPEAPPETTEENKKEAN